MTIGRASRVVLPALLAVAVLAVLFTTIFPTRTLLAQRSAIGERRQLLADLATERAELQAQVEVLETPQEVERLARRDFAMIRPGEEAYQVLPPAPAPVALPNAWPYTSLPQ